MTQEAFAALADEQFIVLTTYRLDGTPVPTCVWFAADGAALVVTTRDVSGKIRRVRNNPAVTVAASDRAGVVHGPTLAGVAQLLAPEEFAHANALLRAKYQPMYDQMVNRPTEPAAGNRVFLVVRPQPAPEA